MKPAAFDYEAPYAIEHVLDLLREHGDECKPLAGGQSLVPLLAMRLARFTLLIDINRVEGLAGLHRDNGVLRIGAMTRQAAIEHSGEVAAAVPLLTRATPRIGHFQIRNRGTIGGSIAHADPAAEYPAVAVALDATLIVRSANSGQRRIPAGEAFVAHWTTSLRPDELLVEIEFPVWAGRCGFAVEEVARRGGDFAIVGTACGVGLGEDGRFDRAAIALFGAGPAPVRAHAVERALVGARPSLDLIEEAARRAADGLDPPDDLHASGDFRRHLAGHVVRLALEAAVEEAERGR